jgi:hypothetical protein
MPGPPIKRYTLVPGDRDGRLRRVRLAPLDAGARAQRLERMEQVVERERAGEDGAARDERPR